MRREIVFAHEDFDNLRRHLLRTESVEQAAFLVCGVSQTSKRLALLVREVLPVPATGFLAQESLRLSIAPEFTNRILKRCRAERRAVVLCHSHPFSTSAAHYSWTDDEGERILFDSFHQRVPGLPHASLLFTQSSLTGRFWSKEGELHPVDFVRIVGEHVQILDPKAESAERKTKRPSPEHSRQVLFVGEQGQWAIRSARVFIIGVGGTGSVVFEMLLRLGVEEITIIDPDKVEASNLSRILGSVRRDIGRPKVEALSEWASEVNPNVRVRSVIGSITDQTTALELRDADFIFCCTDNHWSRAVLNQLSYQYLVPVIDMGVQLVVESGRLTHAAGKVVRLGPGFPCLWCYGDITSERVMEENLPPADRARLAREGYVRGLDVPHPSVVTFNTSVSSAAVTEFLKAITRTPGFEPAVVRLNFDFLAGNVRRATADRAPNCVCAETAFKALGDLERLPVATK